jgi:succinyldiaminopimelate transaminase
MRTNPVLAQLGAYPITEIQDTARRMRDAGERLIDFSIGDPHEPTPPFIRDAVRGAVPEVTQYPQTSGLAVLREAIAGYASRRFGVAIDPTTQVMPVSGAKEAIFSTPFGFIDPNGNDLVAWGTPSYPVYERGTAFAGAEALQIVLSGDFVLRVTDVPEDAWDRLRMLWVCTPHNPTGAVTSLDDLGALYARCRETDTLLLSDEAYGDTYADDPPPSILDVAGSAMTGALAFFSCSKRSGMTGYRSGAIVGDAEAIEVLRRLRSSVGVASPEFIQEAAAAAWSDDGHAAERREIFSAKRATLRSGFEAAGLEIVGSEAGLYLWVKVDDDMAATKRLLAEGVVVSPGRAFGPGGEGHIRLALVPTVEECAEAVEVVTRCLTMSN